MACRVNQQSTATVQQY